MLVLTRKTGDGIIIGDNIKVKIIEIKGAGIRIGIEAPRECKIYREEIFERISQENKEALEWKLEDFESILPKTLQKKR